MNKQHAALIGVKASVMSLVGAEYLIGGLLVGVLVDHMFGLAFDRKPRPKTGASQAEIWAASGACILQAVAVALTTWLLRGVVRKIPLPLQGIAGFDRNQMEENDGGVPIAIAIAASQRNFMARLDWIIEQAAGTMLFNVR